MANTAESGFSPVRQFDPYTRPRLARWPIPGRLSQCLLLPVHVWLTAKLGADVEHCHRERNHQGKENVLLFPAAEQRVGSRDGKVRCKERLGGLLKYYHREAA